MRYQGVQVVDFAFAEASRRVISECETRFEDTFEDTFCHARKVVNFN